MTQAVRDAIADAETLRLYAAADFLLNPAFHVALSLADASRAWPCEIERHAHAAFRAVPELRG